MATLTVTEDTDFRGGAAELNITDIVFQTTDETDATFEPGQFGAGLIEDDVTLTGDAEVNNVLVLFGAAADTFSAADWEFVNWSDSDGILIRGSSGADTITGSSRNDVILGNGGADDIDAGAGDDTIQILNPNVPALTTIEGGSDVNFDTISLTALVAQTYDLSAIPITGIEQLSFFNAQTAILSGGQIGSGAITRVAGMAGDANSLVIRGDDVDLTGVQFFGWGGDDTVAIEASSTISNDLVGSNQGESIEGSLNSTDTMTGRGGADALTGGGGSDTFRYLAGTDVVAGETIDGGSNPDTIRLENAGAISFVGISIVDVEILSFSSGSTATFGSNQVTAGEIAIVSGSAGVDRLIVTTIGQVADLSGVGVADWTNGTDEITINGSGLADLIVGSAMSDRLDGRGGADAMQGGFGNDTYVVDNAGDTTVEAAGGGTDTVSSTITETLAANVENLVLNGAAAINGTGNGGINAITGNSAANQLSGLAGSDTLSGFGGNDRLDGGTAADTMAGGNGNDTYVVDNAGDTASEVSGSGVDTVSSTVTFVLGTGIEDLSLTGGAAINGTGNASANTVTGNSAANTLSGLADSDTLTGFGGNDRLDGGAHADAMSGGNGNDTYVVDNAGDTASEATGSGVDTVSSTVTFTLSAGIETLALNGAAAINGTGNAGANTLFGNAAANRLDANAGNDAMTGFGGADIFVFDDGDGADTIEDFQNGSDRCDLTAVAGVDDFSDLVLTDTGAGVDVDYGTGSFELANVADINTIGASDFIFA